MLNEIGSNFWISPEDIQVGGYLVPPDNFGCAGSDYVWMSTGRSAIALVLDTIEARNPNISKIAVISPFTCHTVIEPFLVRGYELHTYHVNTQLMAKSDDILKAIKKYNAGVVLIHRYFGINTIPYIDAITPYLKSLGIEFIEDCTQTMYSTFMKANADYYVGSIRKWCGVPDGGFAVCKIGTFDNKPTSFDNKLQNMKKRASLEKYEFVFEGKGDKQDFLNHYREAENILDFQNNYYAISDLSINIQSHLNIEKMKNVRRRNFSIISEGISDMTDIEVIFKELNIDEIPLYCPVLCKDRKVVQSLLVRNAIFAPVVWPKADCCPNVDVDSEYLYNHILCIPIDQRYDLDDMDRIIKVLKS